MVHVGVRELKKMMRKGYDDGDVSNDEFVFSICCVIYSFNGKAMCWMKLHGVSKRIHASKTTRSFWFVYKENEAEARYQHTSNWFPKHSFIESWWIVKYLFHSVSVRQKKLCALFIIRCCCRVILSSNSSSLLTFFHSTTVKSGGGISKMIFLLVMKRHGVWVSCERCTCFLKVPSHRI